MPALEQAKDFAVLVVDQSFSPRFVIGGFFGIAAQKQAAMRFQRFKAYGA